MDPNMIKLSRKGLCPFLFVVFVLIRQETNALAVSEINHLRFCTGDVIEVNCPDDSLIHIVSSYFVYVHGVYEAGSNCQIHHNATQQCFRKIQFYDATYYGELHQACQSKQRCDDGLIAKVGDARKCWNYTHSPSDYLTFSFVCVNVNASYSPSTPAQLPQKTTVVHGAIWSWKTTTKSPRSTKPYIPTMNHRSTTTPRYASLPYTPTRHWRLSSPPYSTTTRKGTTWSWLLTGISSGHYMTTSYRYSTSRSYVDSTTNKPNSGNTQSAARTTLNGGPDLLMTILVSTSVVIIVIAIVTIAAVIACRGPKKPQSVIRRRLSENSSVFFSNGDRDSISGVSVQTRTSIHGIENPGFDVMGKPPLDVGYTDKIILTPSTLDDKPPLDLPDIHISPMYGTGLVTNGDVRNGHVYANVVAKEPLSEQMFTEVSETKNQYKSK